MPVPPLPPATPILALTADSAAASIVVAIDNGAADPTIQTATGNDVRRRIAGESTAGIRLALNVARDGTFTDLTPTSAVDYEYQVTAHGAGGDDSTSAWTRIEVGRYGRTHYDTSVYG